MDKINTTEAIAAIDMLVKNFGETLVLTRARAAFEAVNDTEAMRDVVLAEITDAVAQRERVKAESAAECERLTAELAHERARHAVRLAEAQAEADAAVAAARAITAEARAKVGEARTAEARLKDANECRARVRDILAGTADVLAKR